MVDMAVAGSTNAVLHILSMAVELDIDITMKDFDKLAEDIPCICGVIPSGGLYGCRFPLCRRNFRCNEDA
jgi:dihydroxyacid dehydratase/phosphogluconate dehydratase